MTPVKPVWFKEVQLAELQGMGSGTLLEALGIRLTQIGPDFLMGTMPVDHRTCQPMRILHGGASVALAETLGSVAGNLVLDHTRFFSVGIEINANHLRQVASGVVTGRASAVHLGRRNQVWQVDISDDSARLVCVSRLTLAILEHDRGARS